MDRYNAAVNLTLPHGAPIGQQVRKFPRTTGGPVGVPGRVCHTAQMAYTTLQNVRSTMRTLTLMCLLSLLLVLHTRALTSAAASESSKTSKAGPNQGLTLDEIGRGMKSAVKNIEEEIPKIGPAIGETFKKVTGSDKEKTHPKESPQNSAKSKK